MGIHLVPVATSATKLLIENTLGSPLLVTYRQAETSKPKQK